MRTTFFFESYENLNVCENVKSFFVTRSTTTLKLKVSLLKLVTRFFFTILSNVEYQGFKNSRIFKDLIKCQNFIIKW